MLSRLKIRTRMSVGFGILVLISLLMIGIGGFGLNVAQSSLSGITHQLIPVNVITARAKLALVQSESAEYEMLAFMADADAVKRAHARWREQQVLLDKALQDFAAIAKAPEQQKSRETFAAHLKTYRDLLEPAARRLEVGGFATARAAGAALDEADKGFKPAQSMLADIETTLEKGSAQIFDRVNGALRTILRILLACGALGVLIAVVLSWRMTRSVLAPVKEVAAFAERMADGDLTQAPQVIGADELADMTATLQRMQRSLVGIIHQVRESAEGIRLASAEVATGNHDLSARTEQAASNLEETAASMEEMSSTVHHSAESARSARQLADVAGDSAKQGGVVVGRVVHTMSEINAASSKISDIIGVIDGIAFQTNILALNAAVEAARAGEQGRGFAVVAGEVRTLAQRSAEAAKEIKTLIVASVEKVNEGSDLVRDAGSTMQEIVDNVVRLRSIVGEISSAASEQSEGVNQINAAIANLDQMTQQNAALVEQSAAAASSMSDQATQLTDVVKTFRLGGDASSLRADLPSSRGAPQLLEHRRLQSPSS